MELSPSLPLQGSEKNNNPPKKKQLSNDSHGKMEKVRYKKQWVHDVLAEFLRFNEDVEVGFLELLCEHAEDIRGDRKLSQVVDNQVEQQLWREAWSVSETENPALISMWLHLPNTHTLLCVKV